KSSMCSDAASENPITPLMKLSRLFAILAVALFTSVSLHAATYSYPSEADAWFTFELPDAWNPKIEDAALEATAPSDGAYVAFWVLKDRADFKNLDKDLGEILKNSVTDVMMTTKPTKREI